MKQSVTEPILVAALLIVCGIFGILETTSAVAERHRNGQPVLAWLNLHPRGSAGPGAWYFLSYSWKDQTLHAMYIPPSIRIESVKSILSQTTGDAYDIDWAVDPDVDPASPQEFKEWVLRWAHNPGFWLRLPGLLRHLGKTVVPKPSVYDAYLLGLEAARLSPDSINIIWLTQVHTIPRLTNLFFGNATPLENTPITVEILNGSGESGVALRATKILRWDGIDVLDFGNAPAEQQTQFLDRVGSVETAAVVAAKLGCSKPRIITQVEPDNHVLVTVVLGQDFQVCGKLVGPENQGARRLEWNWLKF